MKILHVISGNAVGGAETFFLDTITALSETDIQQRVVTRANSNHKIETIEKLNIPYETASFNRFFPWTTSGKVKKAIDEFHPDIVHHWMTRAGHFSQPGPHRNLAWYGGYYRPEKFKHCPYHVGCTEDIAKHIVKQGVPAENVNYLHVYAEFEKEAPVNRAEFDTPDDAPLLLALARLHWKKGLDILLESLLQVPDAYLWIAGDGPLEKDLKAQCTQLGLDNRVRFLGWRTDRAALLATCDICVFPSRYEPFGAVTVEAWGTETPLIAAKAVGPKAAITHEHDGLLVEIDDVDGLASAINRVIQDDNLRTNLVKNGLETYQKGFTRDVFKKNIQDLYRKVLAANNN